MNHAIDREAPKLESTRERQRPTIAVIIAMQAEAQPIIDRLSLTETDGDSGLPHRRFEGEVADVGVVVATNGVDPVHEVDAIGTAPAVLNTWSAIERYRPALVVSAGTAGGYLRNGAEIGTVYLASGRMQFHDRRIDLPGFEAMGRGDFAPLDLDDVGRALGFELGVTTTGDSLDESEEDRTRIEMAGAVAKDMEAAAVAWTAHRAGVPVTALRCVTDLVDGDLATADEFNANLAEATLELSIATERFLRHIAENGKV